LPSIPAWAASGSDKAASDGRQTWRPPMVLQSQSLAGRGVPARKRRHLGPSSPAEEHDRWPAVVSIARPSVDRPVVLEVKTDPDVVPLPPHLTLKEARGFLSAVAKGDGGAGRIIGETAKQVVDGLLGKD